MAKSSGPNKICDARCLQFAREIRRNEERIKNKWFIKYKDLLDNNLCSNIKQNNKKSSICPKEKIENIHKEPQSFPKETKPKLVSCQENGSNENSNVNIMRPVSVRVEKILYAYKQASFRSQKHYFKERYKSKPEERFYFPNCSSWVYGWRLNDNLPAKSPKFGVKAEMQDSFYRKNASSLQRDPDWYRICQTSDPKNFNDILKY